MNDDVYRRVRDELRRMDEAELFHGLFSIAVKAQYRTPAFPSYYAANLLFDLNPTCQFNCEEAIRAMLIEWDVSTEEVPFYVFKQFGIHDIREAAGKIRNEPLSEIERSLLDTVIYWANIADREGIEAIEKRRIM